MEQVAFHPDDIEEVARAGFISQLTKQGRKNPAWDWDNQHEDIREAWRRSVTATLERALALGMIRIATEEEHEETAICTVVGWFEKEAS